MDAGSKARWSVQRKGDTCCLQLAGDWTLSSVPPDMPGVLAVLEQRPVRLVFDTASLADWDSLLASVMLPLLQRCQALGIAVDLSGLPPGLLPLLDLARAVPPERQTLPGMMGFAETWRALAQRAWVLLRDPLHFSGEILLALWRLLQGRANWRVRDFWYCVEQAGPAAIGIISLVSVLAGVILAYLGAVQLRQFGAQIYVANLVSIGMTREMGALMVGIIMAGRTAAAYAAQLGTMQANEEIDALRVMGIDPIDFLVLPRLLGLLVVVPLLTMYADVLGMVGGALIASSMDIGLTQYLMQTRDSITAQEVFDGLVKSVVFAVLIAQAGCYWGLRAGRSSHAVGEATTRAVVTALVAIIIADSVLNVIYDKLGI